MMPPRCPSCGAHVATKEGILDKAVCDKCGAPLEANTASSATQLTASSQPTDIWDASSKLALYKMFFDLWTKTRDERTEYNKYFTNLLFISTLVAIVLGTLGASKTTLFTGFTMLLLAFTFLAAAGISLIWYYKLQALWILYGSQRGALETVERDLALPSRGVHSISANASRYDDAKYRRAIIANYYGLPLAFFVIFLILCIFFFFLALVALFNPSILPFL